MIFPEHDTRFIAINDNVDTAKGVNEFAPFKNIINEWYVKDKQFQNGSREFPIVKDTIPNMTNPR